MKERDVNPHYMLAQSFARDVLGRRNAELPFNEEDWGRINMRLHYFTHEAREETANLLLRGIAKDHRAPLRHRAREIVRVLYIDWDVSTKTYLTSLSLIDSKKQRQNLSELLHLAPDIINNQKDYDQLATLFSKISERPRIVGLDDKLKDEIAWVNNQIKSREPKIQVSELMTGEIADKICLVLPELWNNQHLSSGKIAERYGVRITDIVQLITKSRKQGVFLEERGDNRPHRPRNISQKRQLIPELAKTMTREEVAKHLRVAPLLVQQYWPKQGE